MKTKPRSALTAVVVFAILSVGCASSYSPQQPGRIYLVVSAKANEVVEKDGRQYDDGWLSGELLEAVSGNPAAEKHARSYMRHQRVAGGLAILGGVGLIVGYVLFFQGLTGNPETMDTRGTAIAGLSTLVGSLAAFIGGGVALGTSTAHFYDAINIYNDDVTRTPTRFPHEERGMTGPGVVPGGR